MPKAKKIKRHKEAPERIKRFCRFMEMCSPIPESFVTGEAGAAGKDDIKCVYTESWKEVITSMRKALKWTPDLDYAFSVMLASVASTSSVGDQLWIKVIGPASCGKSTLCEALSVNQKWTYPKSTIRGFHSGINVDGEDVALITKISGKTLITKDGDTLLQAPNRNEILAEGRDIYDTVSRVEYRNGKSVNYTGIRMTWILAGTSSLRALDSSELGERFLDCVIMETIDTDLEDEILWRMVNRGVRNMSIEASGGAAKQLSKELLTAYELTGGYVDYLRSKSQKLFSEIEVDDNSKRALMRLGKFVAYMRARPSSMQDESAEREMAGRLVSQLTRLAMGLAIVTNKTKLDKEVVNRTARVAMDTARGKTLKLIEELAKCEDGLQIRGLALSVDMAEGEVRGLLRFLRRINVVTLNTFKGVKLKTPSYRWRLTKSMEILYKQIEGLT